MYELFANLTLIAHLIFILFVIFVIDCLLYFFKNISSSSSCIIMGDLLELNMLLAH